MANICSIKNGKSNSVDATEDGEYAFFDRSKKIKRSARYLYDCEALIIPGEGAEFLPRHFIGKFDLHQRAYALYDFIEDIDVKFLYYYLIYYKDYFVKVAVGATVKSLRLRHFEQLPVPVPPIEVQQRIVAILDEAFAGIATATANAEKNLQNARELFESTLQSVFAEKGEGWVEKSLSEVCDITSKLVDPREAEFQDYKHIGAGNIVTMSKDLVDVKTAKEEGLKSGKYYFDTSMVLYSKIRPYLMKVAIPDFDGLCSADVYPLQPKKGELERGFLFYLLLSKDFTDYAIHGSQRAGMPKVNRDHLFKYKTYFPPVTEQKKIVDKLDKLSSESKKLEDIYQQKLDELVLLKQSVLQKAFAGELH